MKDSEIVHRLGSTSHVGPDAVNLVRAIYVQSALRSYAKSKLLLTRSATPTRLLQLAKEYTGKTYKGTTKYADAARDVGIWIDTMKAAIPTVVEHADGSTEQL